MFRSREDSTAPLNEVGEDTTAFSVATLRDLVARSAQDPTAPPAVPAAPKAAAPSVPAFLEKGGAVLVMPESGPRLIAAPVAAPPEAPAVPPPEAPAVPPPEAPAMAPPEAPVVAPPETPFVVQHEAVAAAVALAVAPATPAPFVTTHIRRTERTRPRGVRAVARRSRPSVWAFLRFRLYVLGLLALVVASQPWWWNVCDMRAPRPAAAAPGPTVAP
jgi:hypothetical protein